MVIANFINKQDALVTGLNQYDYGQVLRIQGLKLPTAVEIHFGLEETGGTTTTRIGVTKDGVTDVPIPDSMLENGDTSLDYTIYAFIYITDDTSGKTVHRIKLQVKARSKPELLNKPEEKELFQQAIEAVNRSAKEAEGWAHGREDMPERATDNAKYYAGESAKSAEEIKGVEQSVKEMVATINGIEQQVQDVKKFAGQAQSASEKALLSEQEAKKSEQASLQHRTGAETAENNAELAEQNAKKSEQAVEQAKTLVIQMGQQVLDNKNHVDGKVEAFNKVVTDAVDAVGTVKTDAVNAVGTKGTEQSKKVEDEGTKQVGAVNTEAQKHLKAMQDAVNGIVADRQQITQNKEDVTTLKEDLKGFVPKNQGVENNGKILGIGEDGLVVPIEKPSGGSGGDGIPIINTMSDMSPLVVPDSAERVNKGFSIIGNTTQNQDPPPSPDNPQEIKSVGKWNADTGKYDIDVQVIRNLFNHTKAKSGWIATSDGKQSLVALGGSDNVVSDYIPVHSEIKYTVSMPVHKFFYDSEKIFLKYETPSSSMVIPNNAKYMIVIVAINKAIVIQTAKKFIIYESDTGLKTLKLSLDRPITKWDKLVEQDGQIGWLYGGKIIESYNSEPIDTEYISSTGELSVGATVLYKLKEAEFVPLPKEEQNAIRSLKTYYPTTVITVDGGEVIPDVEVTYIADTKNYIDQKIASVAKTVVETQKALL